MRIFTAVAFLVLGACGAGQSSPLVSARSVVKDAWPAAQGRAPGDRCRDLYVSGDRGRYRAIGCGQTLDFECTKDVAESRAEIECAPVGTTQARSIRAARSHENSRQGFRGAGLGVPFGAQAPTKAPGPAVPPPRPAVPETGFHR